MHRTRAKRARALAPRAKVGGMSQLFMHDEQFRL
jgi:hypothetical protein